MKTLTRLFILLLSVHTAAAQDYPTDYFRSPIDSPLNLSTNFGMLRDDHFHFGIDIRTYEKEGLPVYAVADGYVVRIKVSAYGYGRAIYIDHPNGYTSVYAHLQRYNDTIKNWITEKQYERESYEVDLFPSKKTFPVKKGELIGYTGNSGGSSGPHLHFEIRDTKSEHILNPELFGIKVIDTLAPVFEEIGIKSIKTDDFRIGGHELKTYKVENETGSSGAIKYFISDTIVSDTGWTGILALLHDKYADSRYNMIAYRQKLSVDGRQVFFQEINEYSFDDNRYVNVHIDYPYYRKEVKRFQKLFVDEGNNAPFYTPDTDQGKIHIDDNKLYLIEIEAADLSLHSARLNFYVMGKAQYYAPLHKINPVIFYPGITNRFDSANVKIEIPARALYDTLDFDYSVQNAKKNGLSDIHEVHNPDVALHRSFSISIKPGKNIKASWYPKLLIATKNGSEGGKYENGYVTTRSSRFGDFFISIDSTPPRIKELNLSKWGTVKDTSFITFEISDNFSGIATYRATLDGKFLLMEYDAKNQLLTGFFKPGTAKGKHQFVLTVGDRKNNYRKFAKQIFIP
jgi:hypothetical protein